MNTYAALAEAETHLKDGRLGQAAKLYRAVLTADPTNVEALNGLATEALQRGSPAAALPLLNQAARIEPRNPATFAAMAQLHAIEGRSGEARLCLATAIALDPGRTEYRIGHAMVDAAAGDTTAALAALQDLVRTHPADAALHHAIGTLHTARGAPADAEAAFRRAIALDPAPPAPHQTLGLLLAAQGRAPEALPVLHAALDRAPTNPALLVALSELLLDRNEPEAAERLAREGAIVAPGTPELPCLQGRALLALGRTADALELLARTAKAAPHSPAPLLVLGETFLTLHEPGKAAACARTALALPGIAAPTRLSAAGLLLRAGQVAEGWEAMAPCLASIPPGDARLRLQAPRTLADTLLFARFAPLLAAMGGEIVLAGAPALAPILGSTPGLVIDTAEDGPIHGDLMILGPWLKPLPDGTPPLAHAIPEARIAAWHQALAAYPAPRVAIAWGGASGVTLDEVLAALPEHATPIATVTGPARADIAAHPRIVDAGWQIRGYADMAALLLAVDEVLLPDGPAAHLAGALSRPGTVLNPAHMAWSAPWYPTISPRGSTGGSSAPPKA